MHVMCRAKRVKDYSQIFVLKEASMAEKRARGRPRAPEGTLKNRTVPFRCQEKLYEDLVAAAKLNRRTISQEIEARLNQTQELSDRIRDLEVRAEEDRKTVSRQTAANELATAMLAHTMVALIKPKDQDLERLYDSFHTKLSESLPQKAQEWLEASTDAASSEQSEGTDK
jgi:hypothetical protein